MDRKLFNIVLLGAPGSGKGTQAQLISQKYPMEQLSTGNMYRNEIATCSKIGLEAKKLIDQGTLCPDEMTLDILYKYYSSNKEAQGFILDGVPRTLEQARMIEGTGYPHTIPVSLAIYIEVNENEVAERLSKRAVLERRTDDNPEVVRQRIVNYEKQTKPLIDYYQEQKKLVKINGMQSVEKVFIDICEIIDNNYSFH
jgi:adenylate kinase